MRKIPKRQCVVTRKQYDKNELIRIVRTPDKEVIVDQTGKANGRGAYLKLSKEIIEKAQKNRALDRSLNIKVDQAVYEELFKLLDEN